MSVTALTVSMIAKPIKVAADEHASDRNGDFAMNDKAIELIWNALDQFKIELPSWGFANTGTRFGKFIQAAAATTIEEKFSDAAQVHAVTGACPTLALHVQWDLPRGLKDVPEVQKLVKRFGYPRRIDKSQYFSKSGIQIRLAR